MFKDEHKSWVCKVIMVSKWCQIYNLLYGWTNKIHYYKHCRVHPIPFWL